jgi:hypothetical protein
VAARRLYAIAAPTSAPEVRVECDVCNAKRGKVPRYGRASECRAASHPLVHGAGPRSCTAPDASVKKIKRGIKGSAIASLVQRPTWPSSDGGLQQGNCSETKESKLSCNIHTQTDTHTYICTYIYYIHIRKSHATGVFH